MEVQKQVLSSSQRWGGLSCSRALLCAWWAASWHLCVLLHCWPWAFLSDNWCPLVLSDLTTPLWVIQGTVSNCLQRKGGLVCVYGAVMKQCQSPRWGSNLLDTLPALTLGPQDNTELLARCLSPPSMPPLPAYRTPVALTREQWELLHFPFPLGFISIWIFLALISSLWFLLINRIKLLFTALNFLPEEEFAGYKRAVFKLFSLLLSCDKFIEPEDTHWFASVLNCLLCSFPPERYLRTSKEYLCHLPKWVCLSRVLRQTHPLIGCHQNMYEQMKGRDKTFDFSLPPWLI